LLKATANFFSNRSARRGRNGVETVAQAFIQRNFELLLLHV
jgi:hypothetical protein